MHSYGLFSLINFPSLRKNILDNVFTNVYNNFDMCNSLPLNDVISDHIGILTKIRISHIKKQDAITKICRPITVRGRCNCFISLTNQNWSFINDDNIDVNVKFSEFISIIQNHAHQAFSERTFKVYKLKSQEIHWYDS